MKILFSIIFCFSVVLALFGQKGISLNGHILSAVDNTPVADQKVFVVFEPSAQPYVLHLNNLLETGIDGSFSINAPNIPNSIIPLDVLVYTYDCDFQRKGFILTYNQNNISANGVDIALCMGPIQMPMEPLQFSPTDNTCPAHCKVQVNDSLKRKYLVENYRWSINNAEVGEDFKLETLLMNPGNAIKLTQTFTDSITGFVFDSIQLVKNIALPETDFHVMGGTVFSDGIPTEGGRAVLLGKSNSDYFVVDTTLYAQYGFYYFPSVPRCNYTVRVIEADNNMIEESIPTYLGSELHWESATYVNLSDNFYNGNLSLASQQPNAGLCNISGNINSVSPSGFDVMLYTENMTPFAYCNCTTDGNFQFTELPYGNYYLRTEKFGVASVVGYVSLSLSNPTSFISLGPLTQIEDVNEITFSLFPNPADDHLQIIPVPEETIQLFNPDGRLIMSVKSEDGKIDVSGLSEGIYFMRTVCNGHPLNVSFVISR